MTPQRLVIGGLFLAGLALFAVILLAPRPQATNRLSGYIEGEPLYLAAPISGQVTGIAVRRGDRVAAGQPLFVVDTRTLDAARQSAAGQVAQARAAVAAAEKTAAQLVANAAVAQANAAEAEREAERARRVMALGHGAISQQDADKAAAAALGARAALDAARRQADAARAEVDAAQGQLGQAEGARADAGARFGQAAPVSPTDARVEDVFFQAGEWAGANQPVVSLLPDDRVRLRFFAPERQVARYRIGQLVRFACDGCAAGLTARINYVSPRPEFTPPVIYSLESRDRLVFLVEAEPKDPRGLTPGLPVDVDPLGP
jgi:HlyD family secretion protein